MNLKQHQSVSWKSPKFRAVALNKEVPATFGSELSRFITSKKNFSMAMAGDSDGSITFGNRKRQKPALLRKN